VDPLAVTAENAAPAQTVAPAGPLGPAAGSGSRGRWRSEWLTLLLALLVVYVFATSTLPALLERSTLRDRRAETEQEIQRVGRDVRVLQDWNDGARTDPQLRERLLESQRLSPEAPGYRELPDPGTAPAKPKTGSKG
jgi:hypothetical protein